MSLRIIGAGLPRTGTSSLKIAIEQLTGAPCYHMTEVFPRAETHLPLWNRVLAGELAVIDEILAGFGSAIDWPTSSFWRELADRHPSAIIVLTRRMEPGDGWRPLCSALGTAVPDTPYPHANTTAEFRAMSGWD